MDYNKNAAQNVVLYLSHRELILAVLVDVEDSILTLPFP